MPVPEQNSDKIIEMVAIKFDALNNRSGAILMAADLIKEYISVCATLLSELNKANTRIKELEKQINKQD
jgi:hypothetical protein